MFLGKMTWLADWSHLRGIPGRTVRKSRARVCRIGKVIAALVEREQRIVHGTADDPKQERKLRRRKKWASFWEYPLDSQWSWGKSLNLKGQERKP